MTTLTTDKNDGIETVHTRMMKFIREQINPLDLVAAQLIYNLVDGTNHANDPPTIKLIISIPLDKSLDTNFMIELEFEFSNDNIYIYVPSDSDDHKIMKVNISDNPNMQHYIRGVIKDAMDNMREKYDEAMKLTNSIAQYLNTHRINKY